MLAQRDHRGHTWTTDDRELPSPPAVLEDPDDRGPEDVLEEARTVADPEGELVTDGGEDNVHAQRVNQQLQMANEADPDPTQDPDMTYEPRPIGPSDIVYDLGQSGTPKMQVVEVLAETVVEYERREDFDIAAYKNHPHLPVRSDDRVLACTYVPDDPGAEPKGNNPYPVPEGRLARAPMEDADGGRRVADRIRVDLLEQLFVRAGEDDEAAVEVLERYARDVGLAAGVVDEARELAEVEATIGGGE